MEINYDLEISDLDLIFNCLFWKPVRKLDKFKVDENRIAVRRKFPGLLKKTHRTRDRVTITLLTHTHACANAHKI